MAKERHWFVAADGSDTNEGSIGAPLATLEGARQRIAESDERGCAPVTVWVRQGTYRLSEPRVVTGSYSGTEGAPVCYRAFEGERPALSGGVKVTGVWETLQGGIWRCTLDAHCRRLAFTQLFVDDKRQIRARFPNRDPRYPVYNPNDPEMPGFAKVHDRDLSGETVPDGAGGGVAFDPLSFSGRAWARPDEAVVHAFPDHHYGCLQWRLTQVDRGKGILWLGEGGYQLKGGSRMRTRARFFVENVFEELDAPGEWYHDREQGLLYYIPDDGIDPREATLVAPVLRSLVELRGTPDAPVSNVSIDGLTFRHTRSTFLDDYEVLPSGDWTIHRGGTVIVENALALTIERCAFDAVGGNAVFINNRAERVAVRSNRFTEAGDSAVCIVGSRHLTAGSRREYARGVVVENNLIHDCGVFGKQVAGVFISFSTECRVSHNTIYNMPRAGICINDGYMGGHQIEYNRIVDTVRETWDHGPFNAWHRGGHWCHVQSHTASFDGVHEAGNVLHECRAPTLVHHNYFRNTTSWGIDLDDGTSNYRVSHNVCVGVGLKLREGACRTIENNIFYRPCNPPGFHVGYDNSHDVFRRNVIVTDPDAANPERDASFMTRKSGGDMYQLIWPPPTQPWLEIDFNLMFNASVPFFAMVTDRANRSVKYSLEQWRAMGYDMHSVFADPLFADPAVDDFRFAEGSPAHEMGIESVDTRPMGLMPEFPGELLEREPDWVLPHR